MTDGVQMDNVFECMAMARTWIYILKNRNSQTIIISTRKGR